MYKYIVTWVVSTMVPAPCPDAGGVTQDEFGRTSYRLSTCAVMHVDWDKKPARKTFHNRDSAMVFYDKIVLEAKNNIGAYTRLEEIKIDSIAVK